jgi:hypothetical protein
MDGERFLDEIGDGECDDQAPMENPYERIPYNTPDPAGG